MKLERRAAGDADATDEFNDRTHRDDGASVAAKLKEGLTLLQELLYCRLHGDVQRFVGKDSMLVPLSELKAQLEAKTETAIFQVVESHAAAAAIGVIEPQDPWYLQWLACVLLGKSMVDAEMRAKILEYAKKPPRRRLLAFTNVLARVLPESRQAPLVLFTLFPLSVHIATAAALGDVGRATALRKQQTDHLAAIDDCNVCKGRPLKIGKQCPKCGNPLWKHQWLVAD
ncbi:MAG: hypothetical protein LLG00_05215 [Planctomycetaceae bacterium]|nr:hypothetical protein [Planctomycetaceae bacterium]